MKYIVEYNPKISKETKRLIRENVTESMGSEDTSLYEISCVIDNLEREFNFEDCDDDFEVKEDYIFITNLAEENVNYLEF